MTILTLVTWYLKCKERVDLLFHIGGRVEASRESNAKIGALHCNSNKLETQMMNREIRDTSMCTQYHAAETTKRKQSHENALILLEMAK